MKKTRIISYPELNKQRWSKFATQYLPAPVDPETIIVNGC